MPKKGSKRSPKSGSPAVEEEDEEDFDKVLQEFTDQDPGKSLPVARQGFYLLSAVVVAIVPIHLYRTPMFDLNLQEHGSTFAGVTLVAALLIVRAYAQTASRSEAKWLKERSAQNAKARKGARAALGEDELKSLTAREAVMYSLFINNLIFMLVFLFTAFALMPWIETTLLGTVDEDDESLRSFKVANYVTSVLAPSFLLVSIS